MIGERLKEARLKSKLTQKEVAIDTGITPEAISQYETGKKKPSIETLLKLLEIYNVSPNEILGRSISAAANDTDYIIKLDKEELKIISEIRKYPTLYKKIAKEPEKYVYHWNKRIGMQ